MVGLTEFVDTLSEGIRTSAGERGVELSGGQRQRVLLARAILSRPGILVLDEAMSALDNDSAAQLMREVKTFLPGATWIVVAHRLGAVQDFDRIYVMRNGRIVEAGTHQELIRREGYYHQLRFSEGQASAEASRIEH